MDGWIRVDGWMDEDFVCVCMYVAAERLRLAFCGVVPIHVRLLLLLLCLRLLSRALLHSTMYC